MANQTILKNITVLYAEDELILQKGITETLTLFDINVICAQDGEEGLELFKNSSKKIDLILSDIKMPKLDGLGMVRKIREIDSDIPVVFTTAHQETSFLMEAIALNIDAYVLKPIDIYKLQETLIKAIQPRVLKEELIQKNQKLEIEIQKNEEKQHLLEVQSRFAAMGEMIGMIAHQWRQPLASIGTASYNLKHSLLSNKFDLESSEGRSEQADFFYKKLDDIELYVQNLTMTIDDFRNFFRSDKVVTTTTVQKVIENSLNILRKDLTANAIDVTLSFESTQELQLYENEITHVILNIVRNAQDKLLEQNGTREVVIKTQDIGNSVQIEISDNGGGIEKENLDLIFEPYFSTKKEKNGTGIGLYMSKVIVENNHGGSIRATNSEEGACFTIVLKSIEGN